MTTKVHPAPLALPPLAMQLAVGDDIMLGSNEKMQGKIKFIGELHFAAGLWVGVELGKPRGRNDGTVRGVKYFKCGQKCGIFVRPEVVMKLDQCKRAPSASWAAPWPRGWAPRASRKRKERGTPKNFMQRPLSTSRDKTVACTSDAKPTNSDPGAHVGAHALPAFATDGIGAVRLGPSSSFKVHTLDFHTEENRIDHIRDYHRVLLEASGLHVITSCFTTWKQSKRANYCGKVIPTVSTCQMASRTAKPHRVFFFDDNLELDGLKSSAGICNLVDIDNGEFVDFTPGTNGFQRDRAGRHSVVLHSTEYNSVLVKVSILDAIEDEGYFLDIVKKYSRPGEKIVVVMDVNSTIICNDTVQSKNMSASLMGVMFDLLELTPAADFELAWGSGQAVSISKKQTLKKLVRDCTAGDNEVYKSFFCDEANVCKFFAELARHGDIRWPGNEDCIDVVTFMRMFKEYRSVVESGVDCNGITRSWFVCFEALQEQQHVVVLNSFGVDTRKIVHATQRDESKVLQMVVNYELWDKRDVEKYELQFIDGGTNP